MKKRYIIFAIIALYIVLVIVATIYVRKEANEPKPTPEPTATATEEATPTPTATAQLSNCEKDKIAIQAALDAYYDDHTGWPTENGVSGDIIWDELVPEYMSAMPLIDSSCDWQVSAYLDGQVCVSHTC